MSHITRYGSEFKQLKKILSINDFDFSVTLVDRTVSSEKKI